MNTRAVARASCATFVVAVLAGCSTTEGTDAGPSSPATSSSDAAPETPSEPATPDVTPAAGELMLIDGTEGDVFTVRAPEGWEVSATGASASTTTARGLSSYLLPGARPAFTGDLERQATISLRNQRSEVPGLVRMDNRTVDGVEGFVLEGGAGRELSYRFGAVHEGQVAEVLLELPRDTPEARATIESVLASIQWL
jgi:hypothetical protein